jgi:hypothetical protein
LFDDLRELRELKIREAKINPPRNEDPSFLDAHNIPNLLRIFLDQILNIDLLFSLWSVAREGDSIMQLLPQTVLLPF